MGVQTNLQSWVVGYPELIGGRLGLVPNHADGVLVHAMSGNELSRVRTEFRFRPPEPINQSLLESREPTLLCNQVESWQG
jgi:hypothetical protein